MTPNPQDSPNSIPWPPILFLGALAVASVLGVSVPLRLELGAIAALAGWLIVAAAVLLMGWAFLTFRLRRSNILPHRAADSLIVDGPFALSRNPIYLSEAVLMLGLGLVTGSLWYWMVLPVFALAVTRLAIMREEAHMDAKFGEAWRAYAARARRWL